MSGKPAQRHKARHYAVQCIYQWQMAETERVPLEDQFIETINPKKVDLPYFLELVRGTLAQQPHLDEQMAPFLDREIAEVDPVERAILRIASWELGERHDVPYRVVINEALELAKVFGAEDGHKYVNGVLDKLARQLRPIEVRA